MAGQGELKSRLKRKRAAQADAAAQKPHKLGKRHGLHTCKYCSRDISQVVRIRCAVCPSFHLCLDCFCVGAEITPHRNDHPYQVHGDLSFPLYDLEWGADEETLLLEGIDTFGLGNWAAVSKHVGSKSQAECKQHYFEVYVRSQNFPLPQPKREMQNANPLKIAQDRQQARLEDSQDNTPSESPAPQSLEHLALKAEPAAEGAAVAGGLVGALGLASTEGGDEVHQSSSAVQPAGDAEGPAEPDGATKPAKKLRQGKSDAQHTKAKAEAPVATAQEQQQQQLSTRGLPSARPAQEGQKSIAGPVQGTKALPQEPNKMQVGGVRYEMTGFHAKRSEFEHEYDNDAELLISELEFRPIDTAAEHAEKVRLVEVYNQRLTEREKRRAAVIAHGLLDLKRTQALERRQSPAEREVHAQMRVFSRYQSAADHESLVDGLLLERRLRARLQELKEYRAAGVRTFAEAEHFEADRQRRAAEGGRTLDRSQRYVARTGTDDSSVMSQVAVAAMAPAESGSRARELSRLRTSSTAGAPSGLPTFGREVGSAVAQLIAWRNRLGVNLDITALPGTENLTSKERALCATARLLPSQYLAYKASFLREAQRRGGGLHRAEARSMFRLEGSTSLSVYDLLTSCGWLQPSEPPGTEAAGATPGQEDAPGQPDIPPNASPANSMQTWTEQ